VSHRFERPPHQMVRAVPFTFRRRIAWGDSDTGRIVYTGRFLDFVMDACDAWWQWVTGYDWHRLNVELERGGPAVHVDMDFFKPVIPGDELDCIVTVEKLGKSSLALAVKGETGNGPCFTATLVEAYIDTRITRATPIPEEFREKIERYQAACREAASADGS
jgi:acyl-CoA thioesterase FadM